MSDLIGTLIICSGMYVQNANVGPVFLMHRKCTAIDEIVAHITGGPAETRFIAEDGVEHMVWPVTDSASIAEIRRAFAR